MDKKELKTSHQAGSKQKGKYYLDEIDGEKYSTDSWSLYNWYNNFFYGTELGHPRNDLERNRTQKKINGYKIQTKKKTR